MMRVIPLTGIPEVKEGDDLASLIVGASVPMAETEEASGVQDGDVVVVSHKVVSKAEGRLVELSTVEPTAEAVSMAAAVDRDPRLVHLILSEAVRIVRADRRALIAETRQGLICANAGVDLSNTPDGFATLHPLDPDHSARLLRSQLTELTGRSVAIVIADSFGRPWRLGQTEVAIGCAGLDPIDDWTGKQDMHGRDLQVTAIAVADQIAGAADLARTKSSGEPVVIVRGLSHLVIDDEGPGAQALIRPPEFDLFR